MEKLKKETLAAVEIGILTDEQLQEAINHYKVLEKLLQCHGNKYFLVWRDVFQILNTLERYKNSRKKNRSDGEIGKCYES